MVRNLSEISGICYPGAKPAALRHTIDPAENTLGLQEPKWSEASVSLWITWAAAGRLGTTQVRPALQIHILLRRADCIRSHIER